MGFSGFVVWGDSFVGVDVGVSGWVELSGAGVEVSSVVSVWEVRGAPKVVVCVMSERGVEGMGSGSSVVVVVVVLVASGAFRGLMIG